MKSLFSRRRLWLFGLLGLLVMLAGLAVLFRRIGPWELALVLAPLALVLLIESARYIIRQFLKSYRGKR